MILFQTNWLPKAKFVLIKQETKMSSYVTSVWSLPIAIGRHLPLDNTPRCQAGSGLSPLSYCPCQAQKKMGDKNVVHLFLY